MEGLSVWSFVFPLMIMTPAPVHGRLDLPRCERWSPARAQSNVQNVVEDSYTPSCAEPVAALESGLYEPLQYLEGDYKPPAWFNATLFSIGQKFTQKNIFAVFLSPIATASMFITMPLMESIVIGTGKSQGADQANVRYLATMLQMKSWYEQAGTAHSEGTLSEYIIKSFTKVRRIHQAVNRLNATFLYGPKRPAISPDKPDEYIYDKEMWAALKKDLDASSVPPKYRDYPSHIKRYNSRNAGPTMNQLLFSLVQWACAATPVLFPDRAGVGGTTEEEFVGYIHMWAVIGHGIGIKDRYNIALQPSLVATRKHWTQIYNVYFLPTLFQSTPMGQRMLEHFHRGFVRNLLGPAGDNIVSVHQMILLVMEDVWGFSCPNVKDRMKGLQRTLRVPLSRILKSMSSPAMRALINEVIVSRYFISGASRFLHLNGHDPALISEKGFYF